MKLIRVLKIILKVVFVIACGLIAGSNGSTVPVGLTVGVTLLFAWHISCMKL